MGNIILVVDTPQPASEEIVAQAHDAGAGQIVHWVEGDPQPSLLVEHGITEYGVHDLSPPAEE